MNKSDDPLSNPEIALRIFKHRQKWSAIILIALGVLCFVCFVIPLLGRAPLLNRINELSSIVAALAYSASIGAVAFGIKALIRGNPLVQLALDLNDRVRKLEAKA
jgi:hypothetical protein